MIKKCMLFMTIILMDVLVGTEFDLFVPSFVEIQNYYKLTPFLVEALLSVNFIGYCLSLFAVGSLADHYGRKPIILLGLTIFLIGSTLCLWGTTYIVLLLGRFLQGVGVASPAILSFLIIADIYPIKRQQFLFSILNGFMNASMGIAPVIGSYVTLYFGWKGNFVALLLLGIFVFIMTVIFIPVNNLEIHKEKSKANGYAQIIKSENLMILLVSLMFMFVPYWIFVGISPLLYMKDLGVSLEHFGYYQGSLAMIFAIGSIVYGYFINKYEHKATLSVSNFLFIISLLGIGLLIYFNSASPLLITAIMLIYVIGHIMPTAINYPIALNFIPSAKGRASAILQGGRLVLSAIGLQLAGYFYQNSFRNVGIIIDVFLLITIITLYLVNNNRVLTNYVEKSAHQ